MLGGQMLAAGWSARSGPPVARASAGLIILVAAILLPGSVLGADAAVIKRGPAGDKVVALTIDDGWDPRRCQEMYDTLVAFEVPATWFPNAVYVNRSPGLWKRIATRYPIANHTTHHRSLPTLSTRRIREEIESNERRIEAVTGRPMSKILRPPYGAFDRRVLRVAGQLGYATVALWDVETADTARTASVRSVARRGSRGEPGSIVLLHCGPEVTPRALPLIIARYACAGFRFVTLEGLLAGDAGVAAATSCPAPPLPRGKAQGTNRGSEQEPSTRAELQGHEWQLTEAAVSGGALEPVPPEERLTLRVGPRTVSGRLGCDPYSVPLVIDRQERLSFGRLMRGRERCPSGEGPAHLETLTEGARFRLADGTLELLDGRGHARLRFRAVAPTDVLGEWRVSGIVDADGVIAELVTARPLTADFGATGTLRGSTGCNAYVGGYSAREERLVAGPLLTGPAACAEEIAAIEARFLEAMHSVATWRADDGALELLDASERVVMRLVSLEPTS